MIMWPFRWWYHWGWFCIFSLPSTKSLPSLKVLVFSKPDGPGILTVTPPRAELPQVSPSLILELRYSRPLGTAPQAQGGLLSGLIFHRGGSLACRQGRPRG